MFELTHWSADDVARFLKIRQEFFLDPMGSNKDRFVDASVLLQRALFDWYLQAPGSKFEGMLSLVGKEIEHWSALRKEEQRTLLDRRFALNTASPDIPAVESSVSENQFQRIFGSLGLGLADPGTFDRFLVQLDEETNPSLRVNHRYMGELLPHDNMVSYLSSVLATFLNENAIIGKASPCVTHMEQAAVRWLLTLVGWDGGFHVDSQASGVPLQRLPTIWGPNQHYQKWDREEPTGTIVAGGAIANISALMIARSAVFDYLLCWDGAVQSLGPALAWECVRKIWGYKRMVVLTSKGSHYSVKKAAFQAGLAPCNVLELSGSVDPWRLDKDALAEVLAGGTKDSKTPEDGGAPKGKNPSGLMKDDLIVAVVLITGKTEHGYVDDVEGIAEVLNGHAKNVSTDGNIRETVAALPSLSTIVNRMYGTMPNAEDDALAILRVAVAEGAHWDTVDEFCNRRRAYKENPDKADLAEILTRAKEPHNEINYARHNRLFLHVDAAHGGGYLTVPKLRHKEFAGIEHADTITIDGHKSFYCYYPCGGLLIRTTRWARTLAAGSSEYISEDTNYEAYDESAIFFQELNETKKGHKGKLVPPDLTIAFRDRMDLAAQQKLIGRSIAKHSELAHQPFNQYLEGSRGPQGIMQLYFGLATLGMRGYQSILEWTYLLRERCAEAISIGLFEVRLVTDVPLHIESTPNTPRVDAQTTDKQDSGDLLKLAAIGQSNAAGREEIAQPLRVGRVMPIAGGRFLLLSGGTCNQLLVTYAPDREAKLIATAPYGYWKTERKGVTRLVDTMRFLWRVNEYLWNEHLYANALFTYYLGHTPVKLILPSVGMPATPAEISELKGDKRKHIRMGDRRLRVNRLASLLQGWNKWAQPAPSGRAGFFDALAEEVGRQEVCEKRDSGRSITEAAKWYARMDKKRDEPRSESPFGEMKVEMKFFCQKIIIMHPYTDESLLGDMLRRVAFWGEQSAADVHVADSAATMISGLHKRAKQGDT
jgi:glutamate/tyrosine decarboxylase-like PLP-dependent enzyme